MTRVPGQVRVRALPSGEEVPRRGGSRCVRVPALEAEWLRREPVPRFVLVDGAFARWPGGAPLPRAFALATLDQAARGDLVFLEAPSGDEGAAWALHEVCG